MIKKLILVVGLVACGVMLQKSGVLKSTQNLVYCKISNNTSGWLNKTVKKYYNPSIKERAKCFIP